MTEGARRLHPRSERGAELVEFAIIAILLFTILLAIVDFGWSFSQYLDVKSGAREGARLAIVNADSGGSANQNCLDIVNAIKSRMSDTNSSQVAVFLSYSGTGKVSNGDTATVSVRYPKTSLSGFTTALLTGSLHSTVTMRLEQDVNWNPTSPASYAATGAVACT